MRKQYIAVPGSAVGHAVTRAAIGVGFAGLAAAFGLCASSDTSAGAMTVAEGFRLSTIEVGMGILAPVSSLVS
jgi:hypothetical protein